MNEEKLWKEIENCLEYDNDIYGGDSVFLHTTSIENLMDWFKNKEVNLLKEFVEYLKSKIEDARNILFWENENMYAINVGISISKALESFIKEKVINND